MKQDALCNENVDELKKKVLELCDTIDKQNDLIVKYQKALEIASVDMDKITSDCIESCSVCPERKYCQAHKDCDEIFLEAWKEKAGIE